MCPLQVKQEWSDQVPDQERGLQPQETRWITGGSPMKTSIHLTAVAYQMLLQIAKKQRLRPEEYLIILIEKAYEKNR